MPCEISLICGAPRPCFVLFCLGEVSMVPLWYRGLIMWSCLQVLPFASEETLSQLEQNISAAGSVTDMLHGGATARDITARLLEGLGVSNASFSLQPRLSSSPARPALIQTDLLQGCFCCQHCIWLGLSMTSCGSTAITRMPQGKSQLDGTSGVHS